MRTKTIIIIIGTLLIGFIIGFLTSTHLRHKRMNTLRVLSSERYFREVLYRVIEPTDVQKSQLEPIIERYGNEGRALQGEFRRSFDSHNDNYWKEIRVHLSEDQIKKLDEHNARRKEEMRRFRPDSSRSKGSRWDSRRGPPSGERHSGRRRDSLRIEY